MTSKQKWILVLAAMAAFMTALDTLVVTTALSTIQRDLGASVEGLEWTVNAYNLSFAVLLMTAAALGDRLGRRRVFAARKRHAIPRVANACGRAGRFGAFRLRPDECELQGARTYSVLGVSRPVMLQALAPKGESNHHRR